MSLQGTNDPADESKLKSGVWSSSLDLVFTWDPWMGVLVCCRGQLVGAVSESQVESSIVGHRLPVTNRLESTAIRPFI